MDTNQAQKQQQKERHAAASKRHRDKIKQGIPTRHKRSRVEQQALLAKPYSELSHTEKELVRFYRKRDRKVKQALHETSDKVSTYVLIQPAPHLYTPPHTHKEHSESQTEAR